VLTLLRPLEQLFLVHQPGKYLIKLLKEDFSNNVIDSGKGTISSRIVRDFQMKHLSGGDLLRAQISSKTEIGLLAKTYMDKGTLVPDDVISKLIINELKNLKTQNWLLDGQWA
jgi:hypothetical protein